MKVNEDHIIRKKIQSLDTSHPKLGWDEDEPWNSVLEKLTTRRRRQGYWYVAASIALVALFVVRLLMPSQPGITYVVSIENGFEDVSVEHDAQINKEAMDFIQSACLQEIKICETAEFVELKKQLDEVEKELAELDTMILRYGTDPSFVNSKMKIENFRSEIMFQLVQVIMS